MHQGCVVGFSGGIQGNCSSQSSKLDNPCYKNLEIDPNSLGKGLCRMWGNTQGGPTSLGFKVGQWMNVKNIEIDHILLRKWDNG
jgi:hypothetical protein